jgi:hypothetical protein
MLPGIVFVVVLVLDIGIFEVLVPWTATATAAVD